MESGREAVANPVVAHRTGVWATWQDLPRRQRLRVGGAVGYVALLTLLFVEPLTRLLVHASQNPLHSHIPLVPLVAVYLLFVRARRSVTAYKSSIAGTVIPSAIGSATLAAALTWRGGLSSNDYLALMTTAFISFIAAGGFLFLGSKWMATSASAFAFLMFMVPLPDRAVLWLETASVLASADVAEVLFNASGTPLLRDGLVFVVPGIVLEVAQECSGIRSSWVLFITSVLASHLFLESPWRRILLVAFVIPLGIVRNAFRIFVIALLCVHIGPHMIDSVVHTRGGPFFFALSLVPLFLFMWWLWRQEHRRKLAR